MYKPVTILAFYFSDPFLLFLVRDHFIVPLSASSNGHCVARSTCKFKLFSFYSTKRLYNSSKSAPLLALACAVLCCTSSHACNLLYTHAQYRLVHMEPTIHHSSVASVAMLATFCTHTHRLHKHNIILHGNPLHTPQWWLLHYLLQTLETGSRHKVSKQSQSLYLGHVHLLSNVWHVGALCSLYLP